MTLYLDNEMKSCLSQMKELNKKMADLQEKNDKLTNEKTIASNEINPNLKVIKNWITSYNKLIELNETIRITKIQMDLINKKKFIGDNNEKQIIIENYNKYCTVNQEKLKSLPKNYFSHNEILSMVNNARNSKLLFHNVLNKDQLGLYKTPYMGPSNFMFEYINATYNLFNIQQQKINELESKINKLESKID